MFTKQSRLFNTTTVHHTEELYFGPSVVTNRLSSETMGNSYTAQRGAAATREEFSPLLNLPSNIVVDILATWLGVHDVAGVDSAFCAEQLRPSWLELIGVNELTMSDHGCNWLSEDDIAGFFRWCVSRNVKVNEVAIDGDVRSPSTELFFESVGPKLQNFSFCGADALDTPLEVAGKYCVHLQRAELGYCSPLNGIPKFLLYTSSTLIELYLRRCQVAIPLGAVVPPFPSLRVMAIDEALDSISAQALINACLDLRDVRFSLVDYVYLLLVAIAERHTRLEALCISECTGLTELVLMDTFSSLPMLTTVEFYYTGNAPTDNSLVTLSTYCIALTAICLEACEAVTDAGIAALTRNSACKLTHVTISDCPLVTLSSVQELVSKCTALVDLSVGYFENVMDDRTGAATCTLATLLAKTPVSLQALSVSAMNENAQAYAAMSTRCSALNYLCLFEMSPTFDKRIVTEIVRAAPKLRLLCVSLDELSITDADCAHWMRLRPGLEISEDADRSPFWDKYVYPSFPPDETDESDETEGFVDEGDSEDGGDGGGQPAATTISAFDSDGNSDEGSESSVDSSLPLL
jgi:hypothetical protein